MNKAIIYLKTLNKDELDLLEDFINSPFHNKDARMMKIFLALKKFHPDYDEKSVTDEYVFSSIYPGKKFNYSFYRNLMSSFLNLVKKFFTEITLRRKEDFLYRDFEKKMLLLEEIHLRGLEREFELFYSKIYTELMSSKIELFYFNHLTRLLQARINFHVNKGRQNLILDDILLRSESRVIHFLNELTLFINDLYANKNLYDYAPNDISEVIFRSIKSDEILTHFDKEDYRSELVRLFINLINTKIEEDSGLEYYLNAKELYYSLAGKLSDDFKLIIIFYLRAYAMRKSLISSELGVETLNWHEEEIKLRKYDSQSFAESLNHVYFINIVKLAVSIGEIQWAENFVSSNISKVYCLNQSMTRDMALGIVNLAKGNYNTALSNFSRVNPQSFEMKCELYVYEFMCHSENMHEDSAASKLDSLKHLIKRGKDELNPQRFNLLKSIIRAFDLYLKYKEHSGERIESYIKSSGLGKLGRIEVIWLMEKLKS